MANIRSPEGGNRDKETQMVKKKNEKPDRIGIQSSNQSHGHVLVSVRLGRCCVIALPAAYEKESKHASRTETTETVKTTQNAMKRRNRY